MQTLKRWSYLHELLVPALQVVGYGKSSNQYPPKYLEIGGGGVLVTCIYNTDHL